ncbi:Concanavalin A-like lectin/glucanases superfamily [Penicillium fimorum]|uniref:Concanavalin A-like lectin/glucanases superfamily n=1 Tax=Penicillium fimorum TaxID=1882269 RepID=A0A9W9XND5_9EURO|nr:Concanavalin A-like lectin/glucanases superfamily [Penicillium fimorum]
MKFTTTTILTTAILAGSSLAAPRTGLGDRLQARGVISRQSLPAEKKGVLLKQTTQGANVQYSKNWAGVVREKPPPSATYTAVSATFTVPEPTATDKSGDIQAVSAWVGIDGDTYTKAILQTGIDAYIQNGKQTFDAWYEWYPLSAENFDLELSAGDVVVAKVQSYSPSKGVAIIENKSSGQSVTKTLSAPSASATLAGQNAEWIVEDFNSGNSMVPLANFGKIDFAGAQAEAGGAKYGVKNVAVLDIQQNGNVKAHVKLLSDTEFSVTYQ